jgi:hypothetical protein
LVKSPAFEAGVWRFEAFPPSQFIFEFVLPLGARFLRTNESGPTDGSGASAGWSVTELGHACKGWRPRGNFVVDMAERLGTGL